MFKSIMSTIKGYQFNHLNIRLILYVIAATIVGIFAIGSATEGEVYQSKQIMGFAVGFTAMLIIMMFSYKFILKFYWPIYFLNLVLLIAVEFFGKIKMGAERWIMIGPIQVQPSEFAKIFLILFVAAYISKYKDRLNTFKVLAGLLGLMLIPLYLILKQPALSTTIVIFITLCGIIYLSGIHYKIVIGAIILAIPAIAILGYMIMQPGQTIIEEYQYNRIIGFYQKDNEKAEALRYQQENSLLAIGSGGLTGKGLNNNTVTSVKNGNCLAESHTDFIFTIIGEELGFLGCAGVILLLFLIVFECFWTGAHAIDASGRIISYGFGVLIAVQTFVNISVTTMMLPNTGLTLPFVSYGLTSLLSLYCGVGIVLNIGLQIKKDLY